MPALIILCKRIEQIPESKHKNHINPERKKKEVHDNEAGKSDEIIMFMNAFLVFHNSEFYVQIQITSSSQQTQTIDYLRVKQNDKR